MNRLKQDIHSLYHHRFTMIGGYPLFAITADCGVLCQDCIVTEYREIAINTPELVHNTKPPYDSSWRIIAIDINYENGELYCDNCNERIESAYAENEE